MIPTPEIYRPKINTIYPPNNFIEFERWFYDNYESNEGFRRYLPIFWTAYHVNNNYGQDQVAINMLQHYVDRLPPNQKYFTVVQYDDGVLIDWKGKDVLEFNMSKVGDNKYPLPLIGKPHPYKFPNEEKKYLANFVGNITHKIREHAKTLQDKEGYYISFDRHSPEDYCRIIAQSHFTLCYRGYGINSFRIAESLQYGSIPVYISDEFIYPHNFPFNTYGVIVKEDWLYQLYKFDLSCIDMGYMEKEIKPILNIIYQRYYTYEGTRNKILNYLKNEKQESEIISKVS